MKTCIQRLFAGARGFLGTARKCQVSGEFRLTSRNRDLGRQELERFIYW
jgi:hypothetical protein